MARWLCAVIVSASLFSSGCCCFRGPCDPCGNPTCCFSCPLLRCLHPIAWDPCSNDCGPNACESCGAYCGGGCCGDGLLAHCPLFHGGGLRGCLSCGRGCSEIYCDEWKSDPPDCCDPCDRCYGQFTGAHGPCCLGPCQRILAWLDGYRYCPPPNCGPWRPIFGHCSPWAGAWGGGSPGCSTCAGGAPHGADIYYDGTMTAPGVISQGASIRTQPAAPAPNAAPGRGTPAPRALPEPRRESASIQEDDNELPYVPPRGQRVRPVPTAQPLPGFQTSSTSQRMTPQQLAAARQRAAAAKERAYEAAGIRNTNYQP